MKENTEIKNNTQNMIDNFIDFGLDPTYGEQLYIFLISEPREPSESDWPWCLLGPLTGLVGG